jgi:hypothetical protein
MSRRIYLSKSKIASFEQCPKRLWLETFRPDLAQVSDWTKSSFAVGHQVGAIACAAYPNGVMIAPHGDLTSALRETEQLLAGQPRRPLFEATLSFDDVLVRVDLLIPDEGGWRLAEVKSTGGVKSYQLGDIATQIWVAAGCGLNITQASIRHINTQFTYSAEDDYAGLLIDTEVKDAVAEMVALRADVVARAKAMLAGEEPVVDVGDHCSDPFDCPFTGHCGRDLPAAPDFPVTLLPGQAGKAAARRLREAGYGDLREVPVDHADIARFDRIYSATCTGEAYHDADRFRDAIAVWPRPRYYLDFETISFAVPRWLGTRPYQPIPFQFSCHVEADDGAVHNVGFLDVTGDDPSEPCALALLETLGSAGPIIAYNASFERTCIRNLAQRLPHLAGPLMALADRVVDLLPLVRDHYYHPAMLGSYSIKAVLPARIPELSYGELVVQDGMAAQQAFAEAIDQATTEARRSEIEAQLKAYCTLDTWAMVQLARSLSARAAT